MKLWHDDIRMPPNSSWDHWARTNDEAKLILKNNKVDEISMDHDMGLAHIDIDVSKGDFATMDEYWDYIDLIHKVGTDKDDGTQLAKWMVANNHVPKKITIHSWNPIGAERMRQIFSDYGRIAVIKEFELPT